MKKTIKLLASTGVLAAALFISQNCFAQTTYNQATVGAFSTATNGVNKDATIAPNDVVTFSNAVAAAAAANHGGVFNFPTTIANGTTVFRGTYAGGAKRVHLTTSVGMQNVTATTFTPVSGGNMTTSSANQSSYHIAISPPIDVASDVVVPFEVVKTIGFVIASRTAPAYPLDVRVTASYSDGSTEAVTANIANLRSTDDTFFGFTAPGDFAITNVQLQSFSPGTLNPVADRIGFDDFSFITGASSIPPAPQILGVTPAAFAIHSASNGIHFQALTHVSVDPTNISLALNAIDVSDQLILSGNSTNYSVAFNGLLPGQEYAMSITVTSTGGTATLNRTFYTITNDLVLYDSEGFVDDTLYPLGALQEVAHGRGTWIPNTLEPPEIVDAGGTQGKVLERLGTGVSRVDSLFFPPFSSGTMVIEFDAFVSTTAGRTIDIAIQNAAGATWGGFLAWGEVPGKLAYFDNVNWIPLADLETDWHRVKIVQYLSGPAGGTYDVLVNGSPVGQKIPWRNAPAGAAFNRFRLQTQNTAAIFQYGRIDNLVVTVGPENPNAFLPPNIFNITPAAGSVVGPQAGISFQVSATLPVSTNNVIMRIGGVPVQLTFGGSSTNLTASYGPLNATGNFAVEIEASNAAGTNIVPVTVVSTDEPWLVHPAEGWVGPWQWTSGAPLLGTDVPLDGTGPYIHYNTTGSFRNWIRQYNATAAVDLTQPHYIRWKFRLVDDNFAGTFTVFNDRVQFFSRNTTVPTGSTDSGVSWSIMATGGEQTAGNGISAGQTFWVFDKTDGTVSLNLNNYVNTGVQMIPNDIYSFEVLVFPADQTYSVRIVNETSNATFTSPAPHRFRAANVPPGSHTRLHFGLQTSGTGEQRAFDLDSVFITPSPLAAVTLSNPTRTASTFSFTFISREGISHLVQYKEDLGSPTWTTLETIPGDGTIKTVIHNNPPGDTLFYRINSQ